MKRGDKEFNNDINEALDKLDFDAIQNRNREYVKEIQAISILIKLHYPYISFAYQISLFRI